MPKIRCRKKKRGPSSVHGDETQDGDGIESDEEEEEEQSKARVLWIRNITRIQRQVCKASGWVHTLAFGGVEHSREKHQTRCCPGVCLSLLVFVITGFLLITFMA